jgi:hypothetical protein
MKVFDHNAQVNKAVSGGIQIGGVVLSGSLGGMFGSGDFVVYLWYGEEYMTCMLAVYSYDW